MIYGFERHSFDMFITSFSLGNKHIKLMPFKAINHTRGCSICYIITTKIWAISNSDFQKFQTHKHKSFLRIDIVSQTMTVDYDGDDLYSASPTVLPTQSDGCTKQRNAEPVKNVKM